MYGLQQKNILCMYMPGIPNIGEDKTTNAYDNVA